jgi:hypothetical protein
MSTPTGSRRLWTAGVGLIGLAAVVAFAVRPTSAIQQAPRVPADGYIGGTVTSAAGPEAGVWVIAETDELLTGFVKIVVTDDQGRFMLPELPEADYDVWVRGYGLVDSQKVQLSPDSEGVSLTAVIAPDEQAAAQYYPGDSWWSMIDFPGEGEFPGTGPEGNGLNPGLESQAEYIHAIKSNCNFCHQLGNALTRDLSHVYENAPVEITNDREAWDYRLQGGVRGGNMSGVANTMGREGVLGAAAAFGCRAQCGPDAVGLGHGPLFHARPDLDQQAGSDRQRLRPGLRRFGGARHARRPRPDRELDFQPRAADARSERQRPVPRAQPSLALVRGPAPVGRRL